MAILHIHSTPYACEVLYKAKHYDTTKAHENACREIDTDNPVQMHGVLSTLGAVDLLRLYNYCAERLQVPTVNKLSELGFVDGDKRPVMDQVKPMLVTYAAVRPSTVRKLTTNGAPKRAKNGAVARVHAICDSMIGKPRGEIIAACIAEGINKSTAGVQYAAWNKARSA